jgi:hypothetical protein
MKDELEDFINKNRSSFDDKEPSEKVWSGVEASLPAKKIGAWNSVVLWRAAAVVFMVASAFLFLKGNFASKHNDISKNNGDVVLKEFKDVEDFYVAQISEKVELIDEFNKREGLNGFTHDFQQLEAMYMVLKEEMKNHPSQKVKDALVLNLLVRIDLLNQQLHHLENEYKSGSPEDEKSESSEKNI